MRNGSKMTGIGIAAALFLGATGCATRGYVRSQVDGMKSDLGKTDTELRSGIDEARSAADQAGNRATDASLESESARLAALGHVGYHEVERYRLYFPYDGSDPEPAAEGTLDRAAEEIIAHPEYLVELYGYTDSRGSDEYNLELSRKRAESVRRHLAAEAPGQLSRFHAIGFGKGAPASEVATLGEGADRRQVVIVLVERTVPGNSSKPVATREDGPQ